MGLVHADLSPEKTRIFVRFQEWDRNDVRVIKAIPNVKWSSTVNAWRVPLDLAIARQLRVAYGGRLCLSPDLTDWAKSARRQEREMGQLAVANDHAIGRLSIAEFRPDLANYLRPYQRSGVAFMSRASCINGDDMGLGKTVTTIAALAEQQVVFAPSLIVAPKSSLDSVWREEMRRWLPENPCIIIEGGSEYSNPAIAERHFRSMLPTVIATAEMVRRHDWMTKAEWGAFIIDEFHLTGLTNGSTQAGKGSLFFQRAMQIKSQRRYGLSGTPIGGQPLRLWAALRWIAPETFRSKWQWAKQWLEVITTPFGTEFGGIRPELVEAFYRYHAPYLLRRKKEEVAPELPPKQRIVVRCDMLPKQRRQYRAFAKEAEIMISDDHLIATNKLAEVARLKAFASAECSATRKPSGAVRLHPKVDRGGKWAPLLERLAEGGIGPERQAVVASCFREVAQSAYFALSERYNCGFIAGGVNSKVRSDYIRSFQEGSLEIMVMTSRAGGVSINLDRADHIHILDEDWNPDVQSQLEDRLHRISRIHQVTAFYYRTRGTIEEEVNQTVTEKNITNFQLLDLVRQSLKGA